MQYADASDKLAQYRQQIAQLRGKMRALQQSVEPQEVSDYEFSTTEGKVRLSELFGDKEYLFVIHNMGAGCPNCTLWADGFNGILPHIENRAAFVVASPDEPAAQQKFKDRARVAIPHGLVPWHRLCPRHGLPQRQRLAARRVGVPQTRANNLPRLRHRLR